MNGGKDLKGTDIDVAVNALIGALVRHGYLDSISSAILVRRLMSPAAVV